MPLIRQWPSRELLRTLLTLLTVVIKILSSLKRQLGAYINISYYCALDYPASTGYSYSISVESLSLCLSFIPDGSWMALLLYSPREYRRY
jgi:hypothetical protein